MDIKIVICVLCLTVSFKYVYSNPVHELPMTKQELVRRFVEFIHDDKEISHALQKLDPDQKLIRNRRQVEDTTSVEAVDENGMGPERAGAEGGFFDRAAKFVMEVLQRFLKWINTDN